MTLVKVWWISLWLCFHCELGLALSHSQAVEWIFGSRIQSHWPCMTLWPISMFSRILATDRPAVPSTHSGGSAEPRRTARDASSRRRCTVTMLRMYAASFSPRESMTSWRIASSSMPSCSMSSGVRCAVGLTGFFVMTVISVPFVSVVDVARAGGRVDAGLDGYAAGAGLAGHRDGQRAVAQVADGTRPQRQHAAHADAHPAAAGHQDAGVLGGVEDRGGTVGLEGGAVLERDGAALAGLDGHRAVPPGVERQATAVVVGLEGVEQAGGPAGVRRPLGQVGDDLVE